MSSYGMDDQKLLHLAKTRLKCLQVQGKTLKQLCTEAIAKNIEPLVSSGDSSQAGGKIPPLATLPLPLRNDVLEQLGRQHNPNRRKFVYDKVFDKRIKGFKQLLNKTTRRVDLTGILNFCPKKELGRVMKWLIHAIAVHAQNVSELTIGQEQEEGEDHYFIFEPVMGVLATLKSLKSLQVKSCFAFSSFSQMSHVCRRLPNLQVIRTRIHRMEYIQWPGFPLYSTPKSLEELRECFPSLISYCFPNQRRNYTQRKMERILDQVCCENAESMLKGVYLSNSYNYYGGVNSQHTIYTGGPGKFRKVVIVAKDERVVEVDKQWRDDLWREYASMEEWGFRGEEMVSAAEASSAVTHSTSLHFNGRGFEQPLVKLPSAVCAQLHTLEISNVSLEGANAYCLFKLCPQLERLVIRQCALSNVPDVTHLLTKLRELELSPTNESAEFSRLLAAPNLEKVFVSCCASAVEDLKQLTTLIANGKILRKLICLKLQVQFELHVIEEPPITDELLGFIEALSDLLKVASAFLPLLIDMQLSGEISNFIRQHQFQISKPKIFVPTNDDRFDCVKRAKDIIDEHFRRCNVPDFVNLFE